MAVKGINGYQGYNGFKDATHKPSKNYEGLGKKSPTSKKPIKEAKMKDRMVDNRKVKDNHQQGIERVLQRGKVEKTWQDGDMKNGFKKANNANWKQSGASLTPRKA